MIGCASSRGGARNVLVHTLCVVLVFSIAAAAEKMPSSEAEAQKAENNEEEDLKIPEEASRLGLPSHVSKEPDDAGQESGGAAHQDIKVGGSRIRMDHLGPVIVNSDGTISRITNWSELTERERQATLKRVAKRNEERKRALRRDGIKPAHWEL